MRHDPDQQGDQDKLPDHHHPENIFKLPRRHFKLMGKRPGRHQIENDQTEDRGDQSDQQVTRKRTSRQKSRTALLRLVVAAGHARLSLGAYQLEHVPKAAQRLNRRSRALQTAPETINVDFHGVLAEISVLR